MQPIAKLRDWALSVALCGMLCPFLAHNAHAQQQVLGNIVGHVRVARGDAPPQRVLVTLELRGAGMDSMYTDSQGVFGFHQLLPNSYYVVIADDHYQPQRLKVEIEPTSLSPTVYLDITLDPKASAKNDDGASSRPAGANPAMADVRQYNEHFPKPATKEFKKGLTADSDGKRDEAIRHYQKAVQLAPDFYAAHNNLGSDYLAKADLASARTEFEQVIKLNESDAAGYYNLSNVWMLMGNLPEAQHYLEEGFRRQPESALGEFLRGTLDLRTGKLPEAERALRHAIELDPSMIQPRLQLVNLFLTQHRNDEAVEQLHAFLAAFPGNPFDSKAKELLQRLEDPAKSSGGAPKH